jgi:DNA-directed RNA polymerase
MDPEAHPLWPEQVQLERDMMEAGAEAFRNTVITAKAKDRMNALAPVRRMIQEWTPQVGQQIKQAYRDYDNRRGGAQQDAFELCRGTDKNVLALIAVRHILNHIGAGKATILTLADEIGATVEHELQVRLWEAKNPESFYALQKDQDTKGSTNGHRMLVNKGAFSHLLKEAKSDTTSPFAAHGIDWDKWSKMTKRRVGFMLIDAVMKGTGWFVTTKEHVAETFKPGDYGSTVLVFRPELLAKFGNAMDLLEATSPKLWPTVIPPKRWQGTRNGGYHTPYAHGPALIHFKKLAETAGQNAADEYDALDMPGVYKTIHALQETPWKINVPVLEAANALWLEKCEFASLPAQKERDYPARSPRMEEDRNARREAARRGIKLPPPEGALADEIKEWKREASEVKAFNNRVVGRTRGTEGALEVANGYASREAIYFPHKLDWRGRFYPIPSGLQPQGNDLPKGLLTFAAGVPVSAGNHGDDWLAIHTANVWGKDKLPMPERIEWTRSQWDRFEKIADDPTGEHDGYDCARDWTKDDCDKPFQALAATIEWVNFVRHGDGFLSNLPVHVDGTCNGIQHLSALSRDREAGRLVNLVPDSKQHDIYKVVAVDLQEVLEDMIHKGLVGWDSAVFWMEMCDWDLPRSLTKRQVMVVPYGGTKDSFFQYIRKWLTEYHDMDPRWSKLDGETLGKHVGFLGKLMWEAVGRHTRGAQLVMKWLKDCASAAAMGGDQPIFWVTPNDMVVRHFYGTPKRKAIETLLDGQRTQLYAWERDNRLSLKEQKQGIAPNYIHSLDGASCSGTINLCVDDGVTSLTSVHDDMGTHAGNMDILNRNLRRAFVNVHKHDLLGSFRESCIDVMMPVYIEQNRVDPIEARQLASDELDKVAGRISLGDLEIEEVLESTYFFA